VSKRQYTSSLPQTGHLADSVSTKIQELDLHFPEVSEESLKNLDKARKELKNE